MKIRRPIDNRGQALVELSLIVIPLAVLLFGIAEIGRGWYYSNTLTNGARAGARLASKLPNKDKDDTFDQRIKSYTFSQVTGFIPNRNMFVNLSAYAPDLSARNSPIGADVERRDAITVIVRYDFNVLTGGIIPYFSGTFPMVRKATMYYEWEE
ncbi:MAG TPA: TadE family protein [Nitrospirota bacterium]|nr:TadE family protein [Nitrospirota bacterium]